MNKEQKKKLLIICPIVIIVIILLILLIVGTKSNQKDSVNAKLYNIWNPRGATIEKDGNSSEYNDYDKEGYISFSKESASRCTRSTENTNNCNNYEYSGTSKYIEIVSDDKYLSGKYLYEISEDEVLSLIKENDDGSKIIYTYGHPKG